MRPLPISRYYPGICLEGLRKTMTSFSQLTPIACVPEEIRTEHFSNVRCVTACSKLVDCRNRDLALFSCLQVNARIVLVSLSIL
jgi:hypothetical protein